MTSVCKIMIATGLAVSVAAAQPSHNAKLRNGLDAATRATEPGEMLPIVIVMKEQTPRDQISVASQIDDKAARRAAVLGLLRDTANRTQGGVLDMLNQAQQNGLVGEHIRPMFIANMIAVEATPAMIAQIARRADVDYIHHDKVLGEEVFPVQPSDGVEFEGEGGGVTAAITCGVNKINAPDVWNMGITGEGIIVGMIDTGLCATHPDIANNLWVNSGEVVGNGIDDDNNGYIDDINGWDFRNQNNDTHDTNGHGTHTSGTVAGDGTNGEQTGVAPTAKIMTLQFWNNFAGESVVWESMQYGADNGAHVLSASIGWPHSVGPDRAMWRMVSENTFAAGVVTVYAAGNEGCCGPDAVRTPGDVPDMITAGATDCNDNIASFSSRGPVTWENVSPYFDYPLPDGKLKPTASAPGVNTLSLAHGACNGYASLSGTSMATPHMAGTVALMLQANPALDHFEVKQILKDTSIDLGAGGPDNTFGHGRIDALAAVEMAISMIGCAADLDGDGDVDADDFFDYLDAFAADDLAVCDMDGDGDCDADDFFGYLDFFAAGC